jgi:hypothetical protein
MVKIDLEESKVVWLPVVRRLEAEASWVDERNDSHLHAAIREVNAADTALVLALNAESVGVLDVLGVASWLNTGHHELVFWRDLLLDTFLLSEVLHFVLDLVEFDGHLLRPVALSCSRSIDLFLDEMSCHGMVVMLVLVGDLKLLFDEKLHCRYLGLALGVVNVDSCFGGFLGSEDVLVESAPHC